MATKDDMPGGANVEIELHGETKPVTLKAELGACMTICAMPGGLRNPLSPGASTVWSRVFGLDIYTHCAVIRAGLGVGPSALPQLEEQVFRTGLERMADQLTPFLQAIQNGGRKPGAEDAKETENPPTKSL